MHRPWPRGTLLTYLRKPTKRNLYRWLNIASPSAAFASPDGIAWGTPFDGCSCDQSCLCCPAGAGLSLPTKDGKPREGLH